MIYFLLSLISILIIVIFSHILFRKFIWYQKFACKIGWHSYPNFGHIHHAENDPLKFLTFAKCLWCGYEGQIDSQGNLF